MTDKAKLEEIKKLANAMYYAAQYLTTDASRLHKAMEEYHQFIIHEYFKEEPVSEDLEEASVNYAATGEFLPNGKEMIDFQLEKAFKAGANWQFERAKEALLSEVLPCFMHGGEADEVVAMLDEKLLKDE